MKKAKNKKLKSKAKKRSTNKAINTKDNKKNIGGAPVKLIDYKTLAGLCKIQCTGEECAAVLNINYDTLNNRLKEDGHEGFVEYYNKESLAGLASLRRMQFKKAVTDGNTTMLIWLGKQYLEQVDHSQIDQKIDKTVKIEKEETFKLEKLGENDLEVFKQLVLNQIKEDENIIEGEAILIKDKKD